MNKTNKNNYTAGDVVKCESCGRACDPYADLCHGCNHIVCLDCITRGAHWLNGKHHIDMSKNKKEQK